MSIEALLEPVAAAALKEESSISAGAVKGSPLVSSEEPSEAWALSPHALKHTDKTCKNEPHDAGESYVALFRHVSSFMLFSRRDS